MTKNLEKFFYQRYFFCKGKKRVQRLDKLARAALPSQDFSCNNKLAESINTTGARFGLVIGKLKENQKKEHSIEDLGFGLIHNARQVFWKVNQVKDCFAWLLHYEAEVWMRFLPARPIWGGVFIRGSLPFSLSSRRSRTRNKINLWDMKPKKKTTSLSHNN